MRIFISSIITLALVTLFATPALPRVTPTITMTCRTYDANTNIQQTTFHPGDHVRVVVTYSFPSGITTSTAISLTATATATFSGFSLPFTLNPLVAKGLNKNPKDGSALFVSGDQQSATFKISNSMPGGTNVSVFLTASAPGYLSGHCNAVINVVAASPPPQPN